MVSFWCGFGDEIDQKEIKSSKMRPQGDPKATKFIMLLRPLRGDRRIRGGKPIETLRVEPWIEIGFNLDLKRIWSIFGVDLVTKSSPN